MLAWRLTASVFAVVASGAAFAQQPDGEAYETPNYTASPPSVLDKSYGLPSFGMPNDGLPQQRTMATPTEPAAPPDPGRPPVDFTLPKAAPPPAGYTTGPDTGPVGTADAAAAAPAATAETPLYTTSESGTTSDDAANRDDAD